MKFVFGRVNLFPEYASPIGHIGYFAALGHIEADHVGEDFIVRPQMGRENEIVCGNSVSDAIGFLWPQRGFAVQFHWFAFYFRRPNSQAVAELPEESIHEGFPRHQMTRASFYDAVPDQAGEEMFLPLTIGRLER
jgi:hypothetical protein